MKITLNRKNLTIELEDGDKLLTGIQIYNRHPKIVIEIQNIGN